MAGLQRSAVSFRRQGSSGNVWDDKFLGELIQAGNQKQETQQQQQQDINNTEIKQENATAIDAKPAINTIERSRSNGGGQRGYRTGRVSPAIEPPSPKVSACGFCAAFGSKPEKGRQKKAGKGRSR